jgi:hypothetical protein
VHQQAHDLGQGHARAQHRSTSSTIPVDELAGNLLAKSVT